MYFKSLFHFPCEMLELFLSSVVCPDKEPGLQSWVPGHSEDHRVTIGYGQNVLLTTSATVHSIEILNGGMLDKSGLPFSNKSIVLDICVHYDFFPLVISSAHKLGWG